MAEKFRDFDAFWSERKREPLRLRIFGQDEELPPEIPAGVMVEMIRIQEKTGEDGAVSMPDTIKLATALFGKERLERWYAHGLDIEQLGDLVTWVAREYNGANDASPNPKRAGRANK